MNIPEAMYGKLCQVLNVLKEIREELSKLNNKEGF